MNSDIHSASRREMVAFLYKYRRRLLLSFCIPFAFTLIVSTIPIPRYRAESVLIVRLGSEYVYQPEVAQNPNAQANPIPFNEEQIFKSEVAILNSNDLHKEVIDAIGINTLYPQLLQSGKGFLSDDTTPAAEDIHNRALAAALALFNRHFDILLEKESAVIDISFEHPHARMATEALDTLLRLYFEKRRQLYASPRAALASSEVETRHVQALQAARAVEDYKRTHDIYALETQRDALLAERSRLEERASRIASSAIESKIATLSRQLDRLDTQERELGVLQKEAAIADESYSLYAHKLDEARAYENLERKRADSVRIIQAPTTPSEPRKLQHLIISCGAFLSLLIMLGTAICTQFIRTGFSSPEQIERALNLPVLAVFPLSRQR